MKIRKLHIDNYKLFQNFTLDFATNGKTQNLIVICGINGSGKTTLFKDFIYHVFKNRVIFKGSYIEIEYEENEKSNNFRIDTDSLQSNSVLIPKFKNVIFHEAGVSDKKNAKEIIAQFIDSLIYEKDKKSSEAYQITQDILNSVFRHFDLQIEFKGLDRKREVLFKNNITEKIKIEDLSGGEQELIIRIFSIYLAEIRDCIILIDEPESSLHPNWQNRIAQLYQDIADKNNNQVILATHSPHIVGSVRKEQIRVLVKDDSSVKVTNNFNDSYGAERAEL